MGCFTLYICLFVAKKCKFISPICRYKMKRRKQEEWVSQYGKRKGSPSAVHQSSSVSCSVTISDNLEAEITSDYNTSSSEAKEDFTIL